MKLNTGTKFSGYNKEAEGSMCASRENQMKYGEEEARGKATEDTVAMKDADSGKKNTDVPANKYSIWTKLERDSYLKPCF